MTARESLMLWSLNLVLKATVRGARDSRVSLLIGLAGTKLGRRRPRRSATLQRLRVPGASGATTFSAVPGGPRQGRMDHSYVKQTVVGVVVGVWRRW